MPITKKGTRVNLREHRKKRLLRILLNGGERTRDSLCKSLKLKEATLQRYIRELMKENKIELAYKLCGVKHYRIKGII